MRAVLVKDTEKKSKSFLLLFFCFSRTIYCTIKAKEKINGSCCLFQFQTEFKAIHDALIVTAKDAEDTVVVLSKREYDSLQESLRILSNSYLMEKIRRGDTQFRKKQFQTHDLLEVKEDD